MTGRWQYQQRTPSDLMVWHHIEDGAEETLCGSYGERVLHGRAILPLDDLRLLIRSSNALVCERCAARLQ